MVMVLIYKVGIYSLLSRRYNSHPNLNGCFKMTCSVQGVVFDSESKKAIEVIRGIQEKTKFTAGVAASSVLVNIFSAGNTLEMAFNIYQQDFQAFAKGMSGIQAISKKTIENIAASQYLRSMGNYKQKTFWQAVHEGCRK